MSGNRQSHFGLVGGHPIVLKAFVLKLPLSLFIMGKSSHVFAGRNREADDV
jgi:hypothetical protein